MRFLDLESARWYYSQEELQQEHPHLTEKEILLLFRQSSFENHPPGISVDFPLLMIEATEDDEDLFRTYAQTIRKLLIEYLPDKAITFADLEVPSGSDGTRHIIAQIDLAKPKTATIFAKIEAVKKINADLMNQMLPQLPPIEYPHSFTL